MEGNILGYQRVILREYGGPEVLEVRQEPELPEPGPGEVRVRVLASCANFTDGIIRRGKYPGVKEHPPFSPGYDMVGVVDKRGEGASRFQEGQRVADLTVIGAYSEYICLPETRLTAVPEELDPAEAVCLVLSYVTAYQMLHRTARIARGRRILVHGAAGAVGTALLQLGRLLDLEMVGTASRRNHERVSGLGAAPIDYREPDWEERARAVAGKGFDAAFDPIGGESFKRSFRLLEPGGVLVAYGFQNALTGKGGSVPLDFLRLKVRDLLPNGRSTAFYSIEALRKKHPDWFTEDLTQLFDLLREGGIRPEIASRMPLAEARKAHELIEKGGLQGKIVLDVAGSAL